jgi:hypothetical protein
MSRFGSFPSQQLDTPPLLPLRVKIKVGRSPARSILGPPTKRKSAFSRCPQERPTAAPDGVSLAGPRPPLVLPAVRKRGEEKKGQLHRPCWGGRVGLLGGLCRSLGWGRSHGSAMPCRTFYHPGRGNPSSAWSPGTRWWQRVRKRRRARLEFGGPPARSVGGPLGVLGALGEERPSAAAWRASGGPFGPPGPPGGVSSMAAVSASGWASSAFKASA